MASGSRWLSAMLGSGLLTACSPEVFNCFQSEQCERADQLGMCVPGGFCAYPDSDCEGGLRFSPNAPEELANTCVPLFEPPDPGPGPTTAMPDLGPVCGNGVLDPEEDCDDGNDRRGDGCSPTCRRPGYERWVRHHAGPDGADDRASAITVRSDGGVVVAGEQGSADGTRAAMVQVYRADGEPLDGDPWVDDEPSDFWLRGAAARNDLVIVVGERLSDGPAGGRAWFAILDSLLVPTSEGAVDTLAPETVRGVVNTAEGFALVGSQDGLPWAHWVETARPDWRGDEPVTITAAGARADGAFIVVGALEDGSVHWWVISPAGVPLFEGDADVDEARAADFDVQGRPRIAGIRASAAWLSAYELDGSVAWTTTTDFALLNASINAIHTAVDGSVHVAGTQGGTRGWIGHVMADGVVDWVASIRDPEEDAIPYAIHYTESESDAVIYVAGAERNDAGDLDMFVAAIEP